MTGKEIRNWADPAMFKAAPQDQHGPQVQLLSCNNDPLGTIAATAKAYKGEFVSSLAEITDEERRYYLQDVRKNVLAAPLEFVHLHFRISGVTRAFTHQMVRQRTACYAQESMRFAVKEDFPVALPPSLIGTVPWGEWWHKCARELFPENSALNTSQTQLVDKYADEQAAPQQIWRREWDLTVKMLGAQYNSLVNAGMPAEDARGLAPTNVLTQLNYTTSLRHLLDHAGLRLCTQAQFEWRLVWVAMLDAIRDYGRPQQYRYNFPPGVGDPPGGAGEKNASWQFEEISTLFKPICYKTGKCEFMSDGDRYCTIRERVNAHHDMGDPSSMWNNIKDSEWLADPLAAREKR